MYIFYIYIFPTIQQLLLYCLNTLYAHLYSESKSCIFFEWCKPFITWYFFGSTVSALVVVYCTYSKYAKEDDAPLRNPWSCWHVYIEIARWWASPSGGAFTGFHFHNLSFFTFSLIKIVELQNFTSKCREF